MAEIESDVNQERVLAKTLIELRQTYTRAKLLLPAVSLQEMLTLAGAMEQARTEGMKMKSEPKALPAKPRSPKSKPAAQEEPKPTEEPRDIPVKMFVNSPTVTIGRSSVHVVVAIARLLVKEPMTIPEMLEAFEKRGWKLNTKTDFIYQVLRGQLDRHEEYFKSTKRPDGSVVYMMKNIVTKKPTQTNPDLKEVVKALITDGPITAADLALKVGRTNGQGLGPLLTSMRDSGAVKKKVATVDGQEVTQWVPNADKLREYEAQRTNGFTSEHVAVLNGANGVSHH